MPCGHAFITSAFSNSNRSLQTRPSCLGTDPQVDENNTIEISMGDKDAFNDNSSIWWTSCYQVVSADDASCSTTEPCRAAKGRQCMPLIEQSTPSPASINSIISVWGTHLYCGYVPQPLSGGGHQESAVQCPGASGGQG